MKKEYDLIVSLGGNCYVAKQLQHRGMRPFSLALDWTAMKDVEPVQKLPSLIRNRFDGFCRYENMMEYAPPDRSGKNINYMLQDRATGFLFVHHFHEPLSNREAFNSSRAIIEKRIKRLYYKVSSAKSVLFVLETYFAYDQRLLLDIYLSLKEAFPTTEIDLYAIQFNADKAQHAKLSDNVEIDAYQRRVDLCNDVYGTSYEWSFLDGIRITGLPKPTERRSRSHIVKFKYKLWKMLGKSLYKEGAGCISLTLP